MTAADMVTATAFADLATQIVSDGTSALNAGYGLAGNYGRDAATTPNPLITSETQALAFATSARAAVKAAVQSMLTAVRSNGDVPSGVQAVLDAVTSALLNPSDQLRAFAALSGLAGAGPMAALCRTLGSIALAASGSSYQPTSYDDAQATLMSVTAALDTEITEAGDAGADSTFNALRSLRVASAADLTARGANLAPLVTRTFGENLPHLVIAATLYGDATRADELVRRLDPPRPLFMPTSMQVLAS